LLKFLRIVELSKHYFGFDAFLVACNGSVSFFSFLF
jgi:hypothetical protein